ncbi:MAG: hypothetical protein MZU97_13570 [Bacillus subtilis]|nr:hypothetical protein [Bacillus subtilis]
MILPGSTRSAADRWPVRSSQERVILNPDDPIEGIDDSKKLSAKSRERLADEIRRRPSRGRRPTSGKTRSTTSTSIRRRGRRC